MWMTHEQIRTLYREAAYPQEEIKILAELNGTTVNTIKQIVDGVDVLNALDLYKLGKTSWKPEDIELLLKMHSENAPYNQIANRLGKSCVSIRYFIHLHPELFKSRRRRIDAEEREKICTLFKNGKSVRVISEILGRSNTLVSKCLADCGYLPKKKLAERNEKI